MGVEILIVGDKRSIETFICTMLDENHKEYFRTAIGRFSQECEEHLFPQITMINGKELSVVQKEKQIEINVPSVPKGEICRFSTYDNFNPDPDKETADSILFLFSFLFEKHLESINNITELVKTSEKPFKFKTVIYDDPELLTGSTDINDRDSVIRSMHSTIEKYLKEHSLSGMVDVVRYSSVNDLYSLLSGSKRMMFYSDEFILSEVREIKRDLSSYVTDEYYNSIYYKFDEKWEQSSDSKIKERITAYRRDNSSEDLIESYYNAFINSESWKELILMLKESYLWYSSRIAFWNTEEDWNNVQNKIERNLSKSILEGHEIVKAPQTEKEYSILLAKEKYDSYFFNKIRSFVKDDIPGIIVSELNDRLSIFMNT